MRNPDHQNYDILTLSELG